MAPGVIQALRSRLRPLRQSVTSAFTGWLPEQSLAHVEELRQYELEISLKLLPPSGRLLEIGAGVGWQARSLVSRGYDVSAIDVVDSFHKNDRIFPVLDYDGARIPFDDASFDIVFSSNVLEHFAHVREFQHEILRVLRPGGLCLHVLPSASWRFWTTLTYPIRWHALPPPHGARARGAMVETFYFSRWWWKRLFLQAGWDVVACRTNGLFYTGASLMDSRWSLGLRHRLSRFLGSACNIFLLRAR